LIDELENGRGGTFDKVYFIFGREKWDKGMFENHQIDFLRTLTVKIIKFGCRIYLNYETNSHLRYVSNIQK